MDLNQDSGRITRVIFDYAARIGQEQDTGAFLRLNADMARDLVAADRCSIWLVDHEAGQIHTEVAHGVGEIRIALGQGLVGACVEHGKPVLVNDTSADERFLNRIDKSSGYVTRSILVIPLRAADGRIIGAFQALNKPGGFTDADVTLLGLAASYSASAVETQRLRTEAEQARIMRRELEIARDVQARLVPQAPPKLEGLDCASFFRPAKFVGGDYFDFIETPGGGLAFTLGDVSGKGIPAAVLMASIQASLRILLQRGPDSLSEVLRDLNRSVYASSSSARYSTLFCGLIDCARSRLTYINAGHCPPILVRQGDSGSAIEHLATGGPPVGLLPVAIYTEGVVPLERGNLLMCFSDGISEATNASQEIWDEAELGRLVLAAGAMGAGELTDHVVRQADAFTGEAEQADDMTVVTLRLC
jgi:sigma-B regulation protein RsbU (phosphoserine phosphatase)